MNEKLLNHFAKDNSVAYTGIGNYFQGDPSEKALFEVLNFPESQLSPFAIELIKGAKEDETIDENVNEFSRGISAYSQFQDILEVAFSETDQVTNRHYCYYESLVYLKEIGTCLLNKNLLAAFTLLRPFMELAILHLYWLLRCEKSGYHPYYQWLKGKKSKPPFQDTFDFVFKRLPTRDYVDRERVSRLRKALHKIYKVSCAFNHSPKIEESVVTLSGGHDRLSLYTFFYFLFRVNMLLRQLVYLYVLVYPMSVFPVEGCKKWGYGGPAGIFFDPANFAHLRSFLGEENLSHLQVQLKAFPRVNDRLDHFVQLPDLSEGEIEESWRELELSEDSVSCKPSYVTRVAQAKAAMRAIGWALNYIQNSQNEQEMPQEALDRVEGMLRDW